MKNQMINHRQRRIEDQKAKFAKYEEFDDRTSGANDSYFLQVIADREKRKEIEIEFNQKVANDQRYIYGID